MRGRSTESAELFRIGLGSPHPPVRIEASASLIDTIVNLWTDEANRDIWREYLRKCVSLLPQVLRTLEICCQHRQFQAALTVLKNVTKLVSSSCTRLIREHLGLVCGGLHQIATSGQAPSSFPEDLRILALEGLVSILEEDASFVLKSAPQFLNTLTQLCLQMMCEVEDFDPEGWNSTPDDDESSALGTNLDEVAEFALDRTASVLSRSIERLIRSISYLELLGGHFRSLFSVPARPRWGAAGPARSAACSERRPGRGLEGPTCESPCSDVGR